jgi:hypothetical protein
MYRTLMLIAAGSFVTTCLAQSTGDTAAPPANLHPPINLDSDTLRARFAPSPLGLKPQTSNLPGGITLPFGIDYHRETKGLVMPLDQKSEWGVGVGLNLNSSSTVELSPSSVLGLTPKRAPGVMLNKKF